jgi:hypothetical protein
MNVTTTTYDLQFNETCHLKMNYIQFNEKYPLKCMTFNLMKHFHENL